MRSTKLAEKLRFLYTPILLLHTDEIAHITLYLSTRDLLQFSACCKSILIDWSYQSQRLFNESAINRLQFCCIGDKYTAALHKTITLIAAYVGDVLGESMRRDAFLTQLQRVLHHRRGLKAWLLEHTHTYDEMIKGAVLKMVTPRSRYPYGQYLTYILELEDEYGNEVKEKSYFHFVVLALNVFPNIEIMSLTEDAKIALLHSKSYEGIHGKSLLRANAHVLKRMYNVLNSWPYRVF